MKVHARTLAKVCFATAVAGVVATATIALANPRSPGNGCPRPILCYDLYAPVICDDGRNYSNDCYAYRACATGCVPYGPGPVPIER